MHSLGIHFERRSVLLYYRTGDRLDTPSSNRVDASSRPGIADANLTEQPREVFERHPEHGVLRIVDS
jgi:hypothetical protein